MAMDSIDLIAQFKYTLKLFYLCRIKSLDGAAESLFSIAHFAPPALEWKDQDNKGHDVQKANDEEARPPVEGFLGFF